ncbi:hypothetical protein EYS14_05990 [Alteromonadaceae bacterium M269]|nr:hypothetical protein EYS14_05990 [Alteromonadaceae bacterium M269]
MARYGSEDSNPEQRNSFPVDVSPEMQIYGVLQHLNYDLETAYAELIDNSIQSFLDNQSGLEKLANGVKPKLNVRIDVSTSENMITISDNAGGIKKSDMQRALRLGVQLGIHSQKSLSVYGIGMKSSAIWFTESWSIRTSALGESEKLSFDFNLKHLISEGKSEAPVILEQADSSEHYTVLTFKNHIRPETKGYYEETVFPFLKETFVKFLDILSIEIFFDGHRLKPSKAELFEPDVMVYPPIDKGSIINQKVLVSWRIPLDFKYNGRKVTGFVMVRNKGSYKQPGLRLLRNKRVIEGTTVRNNIPEHLLGTVNKYAAQRIYGELHMDEFPVDFMKTNFNENLKPFYDELRSRLQNEYNADLLFQADKFRNKEEKKSPNAEIYKELIEQGNIVNIGKKGTPLVEVNESENGSHESSESKEGGSGTESPNGTDGTTSKGESESSNHGDPDTSSNSENNGQSSSEGNSSANNFEPLPENRIEASDELLNTLKLLREAKVEQLYNSLCKLSLKQHSVLMYIGAWSFLECLTALLGRNDKTAFPEFLGSRVIEFTSDKTKKSELKNIIRDIADRGNCTKHSGVYWNYNAMDLKPAFKLLEPFIISMIKKKVSNS